MATTTTGTTVPAGGDAFDPQGSIVALANSLRSRIVVPVANVTARTALLSAIDWAPSAAEPLRVSRADAGSGRMLEVTTDGSAWTTLAEQTAPVSVAPASSWAVLAAGVAPAVRYEGARVVVEPGRMTRTSSLTIAAGTTYAMTAAVAAGYRPSVDVAVPCTVHLGTGTPVLAEVIAGADGVLSVRFATAAGTLGTGAADWVQVPAISWRRA